MIESVLEVLQVLNHNQPIQKKNIIYKINGTQRKRNDREESNREIIMYVSMIRDFLECLSLYIYLLFFFLLFFSFLHCQHKQIANLLPLCLFFLYIIFFPNRNACIDCVFVLLLCVFFFIYFIFIYFLLVSVFFPFFFPFLFPFLSLSLSLFFFFFWLRTFF